jgi:glyoxalase family protein
MPSPVVGLHHVTAIASNPQSNLDFYTGVMGLRFVKRTVNFDDPGSYHLYFGDDGGAPGTILTFFSWPSASRGHAGAGEVARTSFSVPLGSVDFWEQHLLTNGVLVERSGRRFKHEVLTLPDPDGMKIEIVGHADEGPVNAPRFASIPPEHAIRGFYGVTLLERRMEPTVAIFNLLGFHKVGEEAGRVRFAAEGSAHGNHVDLIIDENAHYGTAGAGTVHHIAFRLADDASQLEWRAEISRHLQVTPVIDRTYFHSIYFREPGGVLFELATDPPGFSFDEPLESLGEELKLPAWLEPRRNQVEKRLPAIELHKSLPPIELQTAQGGSI